MSCRLRRAFRIHCKLSGKFFLFLQADGEAAAETGSASASTANGADATKEEVKVLIVVCMFQSTTVCGCCQVCRAASDAAAVALLSVVFAVLAQRRVRRNFVFACTQLTHTMMICPIYGAVNTWKYLLLVILY